MKKILSLFALLMTIVIGAKAAGYTPTEDEVIILNNVYSSTATTTGYSTHAAIAWAGAASSNSKTAGDPNNGGAATSSNVPCYSVKGNGGAKNITVSVTGVSKIIIYHESHSSRYVELRNESKTGTLIGKGTAGTYYTEVDLDGTTDYNIFLHGTTGSDDQDLYVYAVKLIAAPTGPTITTQPQSAEYASGDPISPLTVEATASAGTLTYQWYSCDDAEKTNAQEIEGATTASYTPTAAGFFYVNVKDDNGNIDSDVAQITISAAEAPTINVSGAPAGVVKVGTEITLTATATGVPTPTIKWYKQGLVGEVETGATFTVPTDEAGELAYYAVATNSQGSAESEVQYITVKEQVATPTFTPNGAYFEESVYVTIASATEDAVIEYSTDGGESWTAYTEPVKITATTTILAKATKQDYINSENASATFTQFTKHELAAISAGKTWNLVTSLTLQLKNDDSTTPAKYDEYFTYADIATINGNTLPTTLDGETLAFSGEYPYRTSNGAQNCILQFITTVPGTVSVEFSNTGGSNKNRWVKVNEITGTVEADGTTKRTEDFPVAAGSVTISHVDEEGNLSNGLRFYTVTFTPSAENITIDESGVATYVTTNALDFSTQNGAFKAYVVTGLNAAKTSAQTAEVTQVPAGTALLLKGAEGSYNVEIIESAEAVDNMLLASDGTVTGADDVFAYSKSAKQFKKVATTVTIPAGKAYLQIANAGDALDIDFDGATAVEAIAEANAAEAAAPVKVIKNGQLFIGNFNVAGQQVK